MGPVFPSITHPESASDNPAMNPNFCMMSSVDSPDGKTVTDDRISLCQAPFQ
jgi:hypothetical protein